MLGSLLLLLDQVFLGYSYRRVACWVDPQDVPGRQWVSRHLEMTSEEANRDDLVSDWNVTATKASANRNHSVRAVLYQKLYGSAAWRADQRNERVEEKREVQTRALKEQAAEQCNDNTAASSDTVVHDKEKKA